MPNIEADFFSARSLFNRQDIYASALHDLFRESYTKGVVLYSGERSFDRELTLEFLDVKRISSNRVGLAIFIWNSIRYLKSIKSEKIILVAGTPFQPFLAAIAIKLFFKNCRIQVSIHGELAGVESGLLKRWFFGKQIKRSDAIRFVSLAQQREFENKYRISHIPKSVTPVPIDVPNKSGAKKNVEAVGFVGRIHSERDPIFWASIVTEFPTLRKIVIGDGPLEHQLKNALPSAVFRGRLDGEALLKQWDEIGILISTAPHESYGLAIREALLNGVGVVARESAGVKQLSQDFPRLVKTFTTKDEAIRAIMSFIDSYPNAEEFVSFKNWFIATQNYSLKSLADLWNSISD
jgi:hypothetical protein